MNPFYKNLSLWLVIVLMMVMLYNIFNQQNMVDTTTIDYSDFLAMVEKGRVKSVIIQGQDIYITDSSGTRFSTFAPRDNDLISTLKNKGTSIKVKPPTESSWFMSIIISWLPMIVLIGVWIFFMRQMQGGGGGGKAMSFGKSRARLMSDKGDKVTFENVEIGRAHV